jgi:hypothetical protein
MAIAYKWSIAQLDRKTSNGFVTTAHWRVSAVDGGYEAFADSTCSWSDATPEIEYAELTEDDVLGWVWANGVDKSVIEATLAQQIEAQKAPVKASGLPWVK